MANQVITAQPGQTIQIASVPAAQVTPATGPEQLEHTTEPPPPPPAVMISDRFFASLDGVVVAVMVALALVLLARLLQSLLIHLALRKAIAANHPVVGELANKINQPFERTSAAELPGDDRNGMVLVAIGLAMGCGGWVLGEGQVFRIAAAASFFPLFVGLALLVRRQLVLRAIERENAAE